MKRLALPVMTAVTAVSAAALLAGCGGSSDSASSTSSAPSATATASASAAASASATATSTATAFNPCASLHAARVSKVLGTKVTIDTGTASTPRCALLPAVKNGPTFELSYLWFDGGLEAAWKTMQVPSGAVTTPKVAGADDARQVVQRSKSAYAVSAFLQNGSLIQSLNGLALAPYDAKRMQAATAEILNQLSAGAPQR